MEIPSFKCRFCEFESADIYKVSTHLKELHSDLVKQVTFKHNQTDPIKETVSLEGKTNEVEVELKTEGKADKVEIEHGTGGKHDEVEVEHETESRVSMSTSTVAEAGLTIPTDLNQTENDLSNLFVCGECQESFQSFIDCKAHMESLHNIVLDDNNVNVEYEMIEDDRVTYNEYQIPDTTPETDENTSQHKKRNLVDRSFMKSYIIKCSIENNCLAVFKTVNALEIHKKCHVHHDRSVSALERLNRRFQCFECQKYFMKWSPLKRHLWKEHTIDADMLQCFCGFTTEIPYTYAAHLEIHSEQRNYMCETCGSAFKQARQLRNHKVMHMNQAEQKANKGKWFSEQPCGLCGRVFANSKSRNKHIQTVHRGEKPYGCTFCKHKTASLTALKIHLRTHTGEKPFQCSECAFKTADHNALRRHKMRHTGHKQYQCPFCPYACIQSSSIKAHMKNEHPNQEGLWACDLCPCKTVSESALMNHRVQHIKSGELPPPVFRGSELLNVNPSNATQSFVEVETSSNASTISAHTEDGTSNLTSGAIELCEIYHSKESVDVKSLTTHSVESDDNQKLEVVIISESSNSIVQ